MPESQKVPTIGFATIGQTPRSDLVPYLLERIKVPVRAIEGGVLDNLSPSEILELDDKDNGKHMVTRLRDGGSARLAYRHAVPRMQKVVDDLVTQGADLIVILCGADWSDITAPVPVVNPGKVFPATVESIAGRSRLGVIKPDAGQIKSTAEGLERNGVDGVVTSAFPYDDKRLDSALTAAEKLKESDPKLIWMSCVGMNEDMQQVVSENTGVPVILARSLLAGLIDNLVQAR